MFGWTQMRLLYGANEEDDLVLRDKIRDMERNNANFSAWMVLGQPPSRSQLEAPATAAPGMLPRLSDQYYSGFITPELIQKHLFPPGNDVKVSDRALSTAGSCVARFVASYRGALFAALHGLSVL